MNEPWRQPEPTVPPEQAIGVAIQDLIAARLGRGFVPLGLLFVAGLAQLGFGLPGGFWVALGAVAAGAAMLGYGLRVSQQTFGRPRRAWMSLAMVGSVVPPVYGVYVFGWQGLRSITGGGWLDVLGGLTLAGLSLWAMRSWMKVVEVERLAQVMKTSSGVGFDQ